MIIDFIQKYFKYTSVLEKFFFLFRRIYYIYVLRFTHIKERCFLDTLEKADVKESSCVSMVVLISADLRGQTPPVSSTHVR